MGMDELSLSRSKLVAAERDKQDLAERLSAVTADNRRVKVQLERCEERAADAQNAALLANTEIEALHSEYASKILHEQNTKDKLASDVRRLSLLLREGGRERLLRELDEIRAELCNATTARDALQKALTNAATELTQCRDNLKASQSELEAEVRKSAQLQADLAACAKERDAAQSTRIGLEADLMRKQADSDALRRKLDAADKKMAHVLVGGVVEWASKRPGSPEESMKPSASDSCSLWLSDSPDRLIHTTKHEPTSQPTVTWPDEMTKEASHDDQQRAERLQLALTESREALANALHELEEKRAALRELTMELVAARTSFTIQQGDMARKVMQEQDKLKDAQQLRHGRLTWPLLAAPCAVHSPAC